MNSIDSYNPKYYAAKKLEVKIRLAEKVFTRKTNLPATSDELAARP